MDTKVTTVIVNDINHGLTMKVGNRNCYARLTSVKNGGQYEMQIDVNWTYQEFLVQEKSNHANQLFINSDDCCDYERITIKEVDGKFDVHRDLRKQFLTSSDPASRSASRYMSVGFSDPAHYCKSIPCSYCGKDWPQRR